MLRSTPRGRDGVADGDVVRRSMPASTTSGSPSPVPWAMPTSPVRDEADAEVEAGVGDELHDAAAAGRPAVTPADETGAGDDGHAHGDAVVAAAVDLDGVLEVREPAADDAAPASNRAAT